MLCYLCDVDDMFMPTAPYLAGGDILCHLPPWPGGPTDFAGITIQVGDDILCRRPPLVSTYYAEFPTNHWRVRPLSCSEGANRPLAYNANPTASSDILCRNLMVGDILCRQPPRAKMAAGLQLLSAPPRHPPRHLPADPDQRVSLEIRGSIYFVCCCYVFLTFVNHWCPWAAGSVLLRAG